MSSSIKTVKFLWQTEKATGAITSHSMNILKINQRRLGHESCKVTKEIYLHITEKLKKIDNEKIAQVVLFEGAEKGQDSRTKEVQYG